MKPLFKSAFICVALLLSLCLCASVVNAQCTTTTLTGTYKTPSGLTPAQAGLDAGPTVAAVVTYGKLEFTPWDAAAKQPIRLQCNLETIGPQPVTAWIKSDGTITNFAGTNSVTLVPTVGSSPAGAVYQLKWTFNRSTANRLGEATYTEYKALPSGAQNWGALSPASIVSPSYGYQTGLAGAVLNYENWTCVTSASVPTPAAGFDNFFCDSADSNKLKRKISDGTVVNVEAGGGGSTTISIDAVNLTTQSPLNFQDTAEIDWTNPSAGNVQIALKAASVADSKLAQIVTAGKVSGAAITLLTSLPAGAGDVPIANLPNFSGIGACAANQWASTLNDNAAPTCTQPAFSNLSGAAALAQLPFGTANQLIKTNAGATAQEHATLSVGAAGTDFAVAFGAGTITLNLPSSSATVRGALASADWTTFNNSVDSVSGTAEEISSSGGQTPVLSLPAIVNLSGKTLKGGSPLVFDGLTADAFKTTLVITDPTAARNFTLPNADSVAIQPLACSGTDKVSAISALGVVTCTADQTGAGGGVTTIREVDLSPSVTSAVTIEFNQAVGFVVTDQTGGVGRVSLAAVPDSALASNYSGIGACAANTWASTLNDNAAPTCTQPAFSNLSGAATDAQIPDNIAITVNGTTEEITVTGTTPPVLSIPAVLNLGGKTLKGGSPLVFEGFTVDAFETTLVVTDPTAARSFTLPNADSVAVQPLTCGGTDKVSAVSAVGVVTCSADQSASGLGDPGANGIVVRTALNTTTARTLTGTANQIVVTNGDGVAGNPTIDVGTQIVQTDQANTWSTGAQDMGAATSHIIPKSAGYAPTAAGSIGYDTTQTALVAGGAGAVTGFVPRVLASFICNSTVCSCVGSGCTAGTFTTNCISGGADANCTNAGTTETNFGMNYVVPAGFFLAHKTLGVEIGMELTTPASAVTFTLRMKYGTTVVFSSQTFTPTASATAWGTGAQLATTGTAAAGASVNVETAILADGRSLLMPTGGNRTAQPVALATNGTLTFQFSLQLGTATIGNFARLRYMKIMEQM